MIILDNWPLWGLWSGLLYIQSIFGLMTIRSRTGTNLIYHAISATILNLIVYGQTFLFLNGALPSLSSGTFSDMVPIAILGTFSIVAGSLSGHIMALKGWIEE